MIWQLIDSSGVGGAERHVATLADGLRRSHIGVEIVLLKDHGDNPWLVQLRHERLTFRHLNGDFRSLLACLRAERPSLLHTHGYKAGILGRAAALLARVPVVSTFHSGERGDWPVGAYEWLDDWTSFTAARISVSDKISRRLPFGSAVIPSYVMTDPSGPEGGLPSAAGFVGRLSPEKGPDVFCRMAEASPTGIEWHVWGDGPMRRDLERNFGHKVRFHGVATDMGRVWPQVGVLVMPSRFEGVPLAALEAAAHGIPIVASRVGGLPTVVDEGLTGWLFPPEDVDAGLAALAAWQGARDADQQSLRRACWQKVRDEFSEQRWLPEVLKVYKSEGCTV